MTSTAKLPDVPVSGALPAIPFEEPRWPPVLALAAFLELNVVVRLWLPQAETIRLPWSCRASRR